MFDHTRTVTIKGTVKTFQWTNPHVFLDVDVPDEKGIQRFRLASPDK